MIAKGRPIKAAIVVGLSTLIGFLLIFPLMVFTTTQDYWAFVLLAISYTLFSGQFLMGLGVSLLAGVLTYLGFRFFIKKELSRNQFVWTVFFASTVAAIAGFFLFSSTKTIVMERDFGKERVWQLDTNGDKKTDKWVHDNIYDKTIEIDYDTNGDGKPDVWEYYKDGKVYKREIDADFDGKPDKVEK